MAFSGALTLTDLNDYLGPSQACIKPVSGKDAPSTSSDPSTSSPPKGGAGIQIEIDKDGAYYEESDQRGVLNHDGLDKPKARTKLETAEISLNDCLACSGCVTSAESVLIGMQSTEELKRAVEEKRKLAQAEPDTRHLLVASISPQTLASLSAKYSLHLPSGSFIPSSFLLQRITTFLRLFYSFDYVLDTTFARHLSLLEHVAEFKERREAQKQGKEGQLPMLASACPGWICYAEKTHGELLPFVSKTKSPQQIAGVIAKDWIPRSSSSSSSDGTLTKTSTYHLAVMPCYDKKLEASRQDFYDELRRDKDVDCVLTTGELEGLMKDHGWDLLEGWEGLAEGEQSQMVARGVVEVRPPSPPSSEEDLKTYGGSLQAPPRSMPDLGIPNGLSHPGSSSGSYLFSVMAAVWSEHVSKASSNEVGQTQPQLEIKTIRNADYTEYVLRSLPSTSTSTSAMSQDEIKQTPTTLFKAAQCYGFRNLQNLVRKVQKQGGVRGKRGAAGLLVDEDGEALKDGIGSARTAPRRGMMRGRGRGMVKRGRGGISNGASASTSGAVTSAAAAGGNFGEEERGYDYVEVMACPGGCVNGGGQLRPPTSTTASQDQIGQGAANASSLINRGMQEQTEAMVDKVLDDAVPKGWDTPKHSDGGEAPSVLEDGDGDADADGEAMMGGEEPMVKGWQGTSKEWVRRVERAYWACNIGHDESKDVSSRTDSQGKKAAEQGDENGQAIRIPIGSVHAAQSFGLVSINSIMPKISDSLLSSISSSAQAQEEGGGEQGRSKKSVEVDELCDGILEDLRRGTGKGREVLLRTDYRAVGEETVSGLAVQW